MGRPGASEAGGKHAAANGKGVVATPSEIRALSAAAAFRNLSTLLDGGQRGIADEGRRLLAAAVFEQARRVETPSVARFEAHVA
jgi:hypothetical protein